jgi:DNA-binding FadR family transcriptional regulator
MMQLLILAKPVLDGSVSDLDNRTSLADRIYEDLAARILRGDLPAGTRLPSERDLALDYDTNRNTLREAVRRLEHARLVTTRHGARAVVTDFRREGTLDILGSFLRHGDDAGERMRVLIDLLLARRQMMEMSARLAAERGRAEDFARIDELVRRLVRARADNDVPALMEGELALVQAMVEAADSLTARWIANTLVQVYRDLIGGVQALWITVDGYSDFVRGLATAISARDADRAAALTVAHYTRSDEALIERLRALEVIDDR